MELNTTLDNLQDGLYAKIETSKGEMLVKFYNEESPVTVANFIGLAEGKIPNQAREEGIPFYEGIIFHRIIKDFMIQTGDPKGTGMGDPGYKFGDEKNNLKHDEKGVLSMANSGANTNGSQFFITEIPTPWLDGRHTIFGKVIEGLETVDKIAKTETGAQDKPINEISINKISIIKKGSKYQDYNAAEFFLANKDIIAERNKEYAKTEQERVEKELEGVKTSMKKTEQGLFYKITEKGDGKKPQKGDTVVVHYKGMLTNGNVFDSSYSRNQPFEFQLGKGMVIEGWDIGIGLLQIGDKASLLLPPNLAYGQSGAGGVIPPNAWLFFDVELVDIK